MTQKLLSNVKTALQGTIAIPGDKSISHRAVMFGAAANGKTIIHNFLKGNDCLDTIACFRKLGVKIEDSADEIIVHGNGWEGLKEPKEVLDVGNSGTLIRLLLGYLAGCPFHTVVIGDETIGKRPMRRVVNPLRDMGADIAGRNDGEFTPLSIRGGLLKGIEYELPVASAQVKSALLLAGLQAQGKTTIIEPEATRDHTEHMIRQFGGTIDVNGQMISIEGGQQLKGTTVHVPGDISSAAFFMAAAAVMPNSEIVMPHVGLNERRTGMIDVMRQMGANVEVVPDEINASEPQGTIIVRSSSLKGIEIGGAIIPRLIDEIPIIAFLATQAEGTTVIKDAAELKVKETNRIDAVVRELKTLGAHIEATKDGMIIHGKATLRGGHVQSHHDHRIGMMLGIAALACSEPVYLKGADAVTISYPNFFDHLHKVVQPN